VEAKIPWASLNRPDYFQPKPGVEIGWQIQIDFSTPDGERFAYAAKWHPFGIHFQHPCDWGWARFMAPGETLVVEEAPAVQRKPAGKADLAFELPAAGLVSINVVNADGVVVARPVIARKMEQGRHSATWDGLDEEGKPVEAGTYRFVGLVASLGVKYLATLGNTSPEPYGGLRRSQGGEYRHGEWHDVVMNPDGTFYVLNTGGEGPPAIELIDPAHDYRVVWGGTTATVGNEFQQVGAR
jgi:DNA-binding beta-propeller fold protein YncE